VPQRALLKDGRSNATAQPADVTQAYPRTTRRRAPARSSLIAAPVAAAAGIYAIQSLALTPSDRAAQGDDVRVSGVVYSPDGRAPNVLIGIVRADGTAVYGVATDMDGVAPSRIADDRYAFALTKPRTELPGKYFVRVHALDPEGVRLFDHVERPLVVTGETREMGLVRLAHRWNEDPCRAAMAIRATKRRRSARTCERVVPAAERARAAHRARPRRRTEHHGRV
jgi:lipopolysaccharide transport system ATP-binding protein